ncbi:MAG: hypothetical protein ACK5HT_15245 [Draconibacterium sp.]
MKILKSLFLFAIIIVFSNIASAQAHYQKIIIPTSVPSIGTKFNPYQISSSMQTVLMEKGIASEFENSLNVGELCNNLKAEIIKGSSMLRCKVDIMLKDCIGNIIWENEGIGVSKDFEKGYLEAIRDAFESFERMPTKASYTPTAATAATTQAPTVSNDEAEKTKEADVEGQNIYFGEGYLFDYKLGNSKNKQLVILNADKFNYKKLQVVGRLEASDAKNLYTIEFDMPNGDTWQGTAKESSNKLELSIYNGGDEKKIILRKQ